MLACAFHGAVLVEVSAQHSYTLEECRSMALSYNRKLKNATNDVESLRQSRKEAFTNYFPTVSASGTGFNANEDILALGEGMSLLKNGIGAGITATQPLFAGGQIVNSNKLAKVGLDVSKLQLEQTENEVELTVEQYYWQVVTLKEKLLTIHTVEKMLESLCNDVQASVDAGVTTRNDLLQVQLKRNDMESSRMTAENNLSLGKMLLAQYIGLDNWDMDVTASVPVGQLPEFPSELRQDHQSSLSLTPEYRLLQKNVEAGKLKRRLEVGKNLPSVAVGAGYMYDDFFGNDQNFGMIFATVSVPLSGWWGGSHAIRKQTFQLRNAENSLTDGAELLLIKMQKAWNDVEESYKQIGVARKSIEQSTENLRLNDDYYKAGMTTMSDLLDAQSMYQQSRDKYVDAYSTFKIRIVEYLQATGR